MDKDAVYRSLEDEMVKYVDLIDVPIEPVPEKLVVIPSGNNLIATPINEDMKPYTGDLVYVRESVLGRLKQAAKFLAKNDSGMQLQVVYGYRALEIQQKLFLKNKKRFVGALSGVALLEATHRLVAVPSVAGHPTGGAVDVRIIKDGTLLDMGTEALEFVQDSYSFSPFISTEAQNNRSLLRDAMLAAGFAPFDGEWWHFSYGDREWASYYNKPSAIYDQLNFNEVAV